MFGEIDPDIGKRIFRYLDNPTAKNWDDIHSITINWGAKHGAPETIWQAVVAIDPSFTRISIPHRGNPPAEKRWSKWPDALLVARAIRAALDQKRESE